VDSACRDHLLTGDERERFERDGYLMLRAALPPGTLAALQALAERELAAFRASGPSPYAVLNQHDCVGRDDLYLELVDWPATFPKVFGVLGWHIQLFHTQLVVTPPAHPAAPPGPYGWHQDNNRQNRDFETPHPHPRVSVKVGYLLSDAPEPGMGNFCCVPGSHTGGLPAVDEATGRPAGSVEVCGQAGDAVLFDRRLWHSASTNTSRQVRTMLFYGYAYRWLRPKSAMAFDPEWLAGLDPVRRQLLGWASSPNGYFDPTDDDVPLREWIARHVGAHAVVP
jgi:ectoine hydroxylase